jgi:hypothetical protein
VMNSGGIVSTRRIGAYGLCSGDCASSLSLSSSDDESYERCDFSAFPIAACLTMCGGGGCDGGGTTDGSGNGRLGGASWTRVVSCAKAGAEHGRGDKHCHRIARSGQCGSTPELWAYTSWTRGVAFATTAGAEHGRGDKRREAGCGCEQLPHLVRVCVPLDAERTWMEAAQPAAEEGAARMTLESSQRCHRAAFRSTTRFRPRTSLALAGQVPKPNVFHSSCQIDE